MTGLAHDKLVVRKFLTASIDDGLGSAAGLRRLGLTSFLENLYIEGLISYHLFKPSILFLQRFQSLRHFRSQAAKLLSPSIVSLLSILQKLIQLGILITLAEFNMSLTELRNDLICRMSLLLHREGPFWMLPSNFSHSDRYYSRGGGQRYRNENYSDRVTSRL